MINEQNLEKLCQSMINNDKITFKILRDCNLNYLDIKRLSSLNVLKREKRGIYSFISSEYLFKYAKNLISNHEYQEANIILEKCLRLSSNNVEILSMLLYTSIELKKYKKAIEICHILKNNSEYKNKVDYYLGLLSLVTDIPEEDKNKLINKQNKIIPFHDLISEKLHERIKEYEKESNIILNKFFEDNNYKELEQVLIKKEEMSGLNIFEEYILRLFDVLSNRYEVRENNINNENQVSNIFSEIDNGNYQKALRKTFEYSDDYFIYHVKCLNQILNKINKKTNSKRLFQARKDKYEEYKRTFPKIMESLDSRDIHKIISSIESYLSSINQENYYQLILNFIKLSLVSGNKDFFGAIDILYSISNKTYKFNISIYLNKFYNALTREDFEKAKIYLNIISSASKIVIEFPMLQGLYEYLHQEEKKKEYIVKDDILTRIYEKEKLTEYILQLRKVLVEEKGIVVLKPMKQEEINLVAKIINKYGDITYFNIIYNDTKRLVLKYQGNDKQIDIQEKFLEASQAYQNKDYLKAINLYRKILPFSKDKTIFRRLGTLYMMTNQNKLALDYLTVAFALEKNKQEKKKYKELILNLTKKDSIKSSNNEDYNSCSDIDFEIVNDYILKTGLDVESACQELNMSSYQTNTIKLYFAREFFIQKFPAKGEEFLKSFAASKDKSNQGKKMYAKILKNKRVYNNRKISAKKRFDYNAIPNK